MKCIRCGHDSKYPERSNKTCPGCKGVFAFEPREGDLFTDTAFHNALLAVSSHGAVRFTSENLYYEICRRKRSYRAPIALIVILIIVCAVTAVLGARLHLGWLFGTLLAFAGTLTAVVNRLNPNPFVNVTPGEFNRLWQRWCDVHGAPEAFILRKQQTKAAAAEADIGDYSFDRAVICDRDSTVDVLLANNFHFENNCAVLAITGYPPGPFATVRAMLKRNPKLEVFALHDASVTGCQLAHKLGTDPDWFANDVKVVDVGLRPVHAKPFFGLYRESKSGYVPPEGEALTAEEVEWLGKYTLELAAIRPEQVLKRLFRAINRKPSPGDDGGYDDTFIFISSGGDGGGVTVDQASFSSDAGDTDGGADGFG